MCPSCVWCQNINSNKKIIKIEFTSSFLGVSLDIRNSTCTQRQYAIESNSETMSHAKDFYRWRDKACATFHGPRPLCATVPNDSFVPELKVKGCVEINLLNDNTTVYSTAKIHPSLTHAYVFKRQPTVVIHIDSDWL